MPTTSAQASVAVANGVKTMIQLATPATRMIQLISWGYSLDVAPAAAGTVEVIQTDVAATVTAHVASGIQPLDPNAPASLLTLGTSATGYAASSEGTPTACRVLAAKRSPAATNGFAVHYEYQWMYDERPIIAVSKFLRIRTTFTSTTPTMLCWICWDE